MHVAIRTKIRSHRHWPRRRGVRVEVTHPSEEAYGILVALLDQELTCALQTDPARM